MEQAGEDPPTSHFIKDLLSHGIILVHHPVLLDLWGGSSYFTAQDPLHFLPHPNLARSHLTIHCKGGCIEHGVRIVFSVLKSDSSLCLSLKMRIGCYRELRLAAGKTGFRPHPPNRSIPSLSNSQPPVVVLVLDSGNRLSLCSFSDCALSIIHNSTN